jgi:Na+/proline symporter/signal transduction histidine kinase/CheY-like chemotaxis protein
MFATWQLVSLSFAYIALLFIIAFFGDKHRQYFRGKTQPIIYALTLGVYCTSWSFLGTTGQASSNVLSHIPIYLGPILLFVFAWSFIQRIIRVSLKLHLTSIADLLAARFGKSHNLAILVTIVALIGTMPYIALQLKAIVYSFQQLQIERNFSAWQIGLAVSIVLAGFTMVFGIRTIDVTERHPGVMLAIAFESLVKIIAFVFVGLFVSFVLFDSPIDIWQQAAKKISFADQVNIDNFTSMLGLLVIVMAAFLSLPRQFHVMIVELKHQQHTWLSRRIFPLYLLVFALLAIPLGLAGHLLLQNTVPTDAYVLFLPWYGQQTWLTLFAFIGAISAASSMVIISSIALSTMLSNEILFPMVFRSIKKQLHFDSFRVKLLNIRKALVCVVMTLGYSVFLLASPDTLASLGEIAFGAIAQLTPALVAAFYWRKATLKGVFTGILVGFSLWFLLSFLPHLGVYQLTLTSLTVNNTSATLVSLFLNVFFLLVVSLLSRQSVQERVQVPLFLEWQKPEKIEEQKLKLIDSKELQLLASRFVGADKVQKSFEQFFLTHDAKKLGLRDYKRALVQHTENTLASVMGSSSARLVISSVIEGRDIALDELAVLVEEASSQKQEFSQNLLQSAIENASEGISVIDNELKLVAWNKKYLELFNYPKSLVYIGSPIEDLIRYNVERGLCGPGDVDEQVNKRLHHLKCGSPHESERLHETGQVIRIEGNPLPDGGFVMLFSDITAYRQAEILLKDANQDLETRVAERTQKLEQANEQLAQARVKAEQAHLRKSQYLKACSHDLMQPLEAARLFTSALSSQPNLNKAQERQIKNIKDSLKVANDLLSNLAEVARIESGNIKPKIEAFALNDILLSLTEEFSAAAEELSVDFRVILSKRWIKSDKHLLRRMLQNLLGNAFRYASPGKVLLGARLINGNVQIQVLDNGPGIAESEQQRVFEQFTQINADHAKSSKGLGLGLSITQSFSTLLNHPISLQSLENMGCKFSITVPLAKAGLILPKKAPTNKITLKDVRVLCIDNDPAVLEGMIELLSAWQCDVFGADSAKQAQQVFAQEQQHFDILLVDYQLENNENGLALIDTLRKSADRNIPAILITATTEQDIEQKAKNADVGFMRKLVKPAALRAMMSAKLAESLQSHFTETLK